MVEVQIRMAPLVEVFGKVRPGGLSRVAAQALGLSERHVRRLYAAFQEDGPTAIVDGRRGRRASNRAPTEMVDWVAEPYRTCCFQFSAQHTLHAETLCTAFCNWGPIETPRQFWPFGPSVNVS